MIYKNAQIFHSLKAMFVHCPKNAGSSIEKRLAQGMKCGGHSTALGYQRAFPTEFASYFKFAVVRHPVDRFISCYYYLAHSPIHPALNNQCAHDPANTTPEKWAAHLTANPADAKKIVHLVSQASFVTDASGKIIVDFIARFENLDADWRTISTKLGIPYRPLDRLNRSRRPALAVDATDAVVAYVKQVYAQDYELFGYG